MRLSNLLLVVVLASKLLFGQDKPAEVKQENFEAAIIPVKTLSGDSFNRLANMLGVFKAQYSYDDKLRTIIVYAPKDVVAQMRRVIDQLDRPGSDAAIGRNIEMTLAFLRCSIKPPVDARPLPADLEPVARQLRAATQYKDVQLWDIVPIHLQEGKETSQMLRLPSVSPVGIATAQLKIRPEAVSRKDAGRYVRFDLMNINFRIPFSTAPKNDPNFLVNTQFQNIDVGLNTAGDFMEGQKTVLGKVSGIDDESAVFVVISLKILD